VYKARLLKLSTLLDGLKGSQFDYGRWCTTKVWLPLGTDLLKAKAISCGTSACALGWAPSLPFAQRLGYKLIATGRLTCHGVSSVFVRNGHVEDGSNVARELFDVDSEEFRFLFMPIFSYHARLADRGLVGGRLTPDASPQQVAEHIRLFVKQKYE